MTIQRTHNLKTYDGCKDSFEDYLSPGDTVDDAMMWYFIEVLPPASMGSVVQIGEAYDHRGENGQPRYDTLQKVGSEWVYTGHQIRGAHVEVMP